MISFDCDFKCFFDDSSCSLRCDDSCVHFYDCQFCINYDCDFGSSISAIDYENLKLTFDNLKGEC